MSLTDRQLLTLDVLPRVTAALSILGSSFIIYQVLKNPKKREMVYHRQMLTLSCTDFLFSAAWFVGSWPAPGSGWCTANGFVGMLSSVPEAMFNAALCLYYMFTIQYKWTEDQMRRLQPLLIAFPIVWGLASAVIALAAGMINPGINGVCSAVKTPSGCTGSECIPDGSYYDLFSVVALIIPIWGSYIVALVSMFLVYVAVSKDAQNDGAGDDEAPPVGFLWFARRETGQDDSRQTRLRRMAKQAFWYLLNFFMTYVFTTTNAIIRANRGSESEQGSVPFALQFLNFMFLPWQGFWNAVIYIRPRYLRNREKNPEMSRWEAIFAEDDYDHRLGARAMRSTVRGPGRRSFFGSFFIRGGEGSAIFSGKSKANDVIAHASDPNDGQKADDVGNESNDDAGVVKLGSRKEEEEQEEEKQQVGA
jgi:hypothetical protein